MKSFGLLFWAALIALVATPSHSQALTCGPRMRKSWLALSTTEQTLYKDAVAASMDTGAYGKFIEMHTEMMSEMEAHRQCMFVYWHRLLLVAFENMLRGQASKYKCVTVPYWDWVSDYDRFVNGECTNMLDCSYALQALGGVTNTPRKQKNLQINGQWTYGVCMAVSPMNHFCQATNVQGTKCAKCVTRGLWATTTLPAAASYASVKSQLFTATNIAEMSNAIETGAHNNVHSNLAGAMETFASPADPIFWSHHAMVDLLHTIFHKCRVSTERMTLQEKITSTTGWDSCERANGGVFNPLDQVTMRTGLLGNNPVPGRKDKLIGKYFNGLPTQFAALMDHNDLGTSSYSYLYQGLLGEMYANCGEPETSDDVETTADDGSDPNAGSRRRRLEDALDSAITAASSAFNSSSVVQDPASNVTNVASGDLVLVTLATASSASTSANTSSLAIATNNASTSILIVAAVNLTLEDSSQSVNTFTVATNDQLVAQIGTDTATVISEQEKMVCMFQDECLGGVKDFSETFKKNFHITEPPRCLGIVNKIRSGEDSIALADWKESMVASFGCPSPKE
ncbi:hypothetical protein Gpo141_00010012 [Globisporangium polare]